MQKPLPDLLLEYDVPVGILPGMQFNEESRKLTVIYPLYVKLVISIHLYKYLEKGKLADTEGMKTKVMMWAKVTAISSGKSKVHFTVGLKKTWSREASDVLKNGVGIDKV